ncbi:MAG: ATP synthase F1 subunit epsilon [Ruminococcus sp.]|nr:ATP synthase F1 subunit epsilon [Ruminococcus sp.]
MAKTFHLEIIASDRVFFEGECEHLVVTAFDGLLGILSGHEPFVTSLPTGELKYITDGKWHYAAISEGFMEVMPDFAIILANYCELSEEIDVKRAEEKLRHKQSIMEYYHTQAALSKVMNRLKVSQKHFK